MRLDDLLYRYFAVTDLNAIEPEVLAAGIERCQVDLGLAQDDGQRFALWALLHMLGVSADLEATFKSEGDREAARTFMQLIANMPR